MDSQGFLQARQRRGPNVRTLDIHIRVRLAQIGRFLGHVQGILTPTALASSRASSMLATTSRLSLGGRRSTPGVTRAGSSTLAARSYRPATYVGVSASRATEM